MARRQQQYSETDKDIALIYYDRYFHLPPDEQFTEAAKKGKVDVKSLKRWVAERANPEGKAPAPAAEYQGGRPFPPVELADPEREKPLFAPALHLMEWMRQTFIEEYGILWTPDHAHLTDAMIGFAWTNVENIKNGKKRAGEAEFLGGGGAIWPKGRSDFLMRSWFGEVPIFLITLDAVFCAEASDRQFCQLVFHELLHCGHKQDKYGSPKFDGDGNPEFAIRAHDVEEFVASPELFGLEVSAGQSVDFVIAAKRPPRFTDDMIERACAPKS